MSSNKNKPTIETLVEDMYNLLNEDTDHEPSKENLEWIGKAVQDLLRSRLSARERKAATLRFSSLGKPDRQLWYSAHLPETAAKMAPATYMKFLYGDLIEVLLLFLAKEAGHEVTHEQAEVEVDGILGHTDAIIDGVMVDCKSASPYGFNKFVSGAYLQNDPFGYISQISGYRHALKTERAGFLAAHKVNGDVCFAEVPREVLDSNLPGPRIEHLKGVLASPTPPDRCYADKPEGKSGNRVLDVGCSYCAFRDTCWKDANNGQGLRTYSYSRGPVFFTRVEKEPRVKEDW